MNYSTKDNTVSFSYKGLPVLFFVLLAQLDILVQFTGTKMLPYFVTLTESEFLSCVEMAREL
jgi:hypothetical protein